MSRLALLALPLLLTSCRCVLGPCKYSVEVVLSEEAKSQPINGGEPLKIDAIPLIPDDQNCNQIKTASARDWFVGQNSAAPLKDTFKGRVMEFVVADNEILPHDRLPAESCWHGTPSRAADFAEGADPTRTALPEHVEPVVSRNEETDYNGMVVFASFAREEAKDQDDFGSKVYITDEVLTKKKGWILRVLVGPDFIERN